MPSGTGDFLRLLVGQVRTTKLAHIFAYSKWLYSYRMQLHGASDLDQRCLKTRDSKTDVLSHQIQHEGGRNIDFRQMSVSPGLTTARRLSAYMLLLSYSSNLITGNYKMKTTKLRLINRPIQRN